MTDRPADEHCIEVRVDLDRLGLIERDLTRALILQNSRFVQRFDLVSSWRTRAIESRLRRVALVLAAIGAGLSLLLVWQVWQRTGQIPALPVTLLVSMLVLFGVFLGIQQLRDWGVGRLDTMLEKRASGLLAAARGACPTRLRYTISGDELRCHAVDGEGLKERYSRSLSGIRYALVSEFCVCMFATAKTLNPGVVLFGEASPERAGLLSALENRGVEVEQLSRDLVPETTVARAW